MNKHHYKLDSFSQKGRLHTAIGHDVLRSLMKISHGLKVLAVSSLLSGCITTGQNSVGDLSAHPFNDGNCLQGHSTTSTSTSTSSHPVSDVDRGKLIKILPLADMAAQRGQYQLAVDNYMLAAQISRSAEIAGKALYYAEKMGDFISSFQAAELWLDIVPEDLAARRFYALGLIRSNHYSQLQQELDLIVCIAATHHQGKLLEILVILGQQQENQDYVKTLVKLSVKYPKNADIILALAKLSERQRETLQALNYVEQAIRLAPDYERALELKGLILLRSGSKQAALRYFEKMVTEHTNIPSLKIHLAQIYYQQKQYHKAESLVTPLVTQQQSITAARYLLASALYAQKKIAASETQFLELLQIHYRPNVINYFLGEINQLQQQPQIAIQFFQAVKAGDYLIRSRVATAKILAKQGQLEKARQQIIQLQNNTIANQVFLAKTEISLITAAQKRSEYQQQIEQDFHQHPESIFQLTRIILMSDNSAQKIDYINKSLTASKTTAQKRNVILAATDLLTRSNNATLSLSLLENFLQQYPNDVALLYNLAMLRAQLGDMEGMERDLHNILSIDEEYIDALNALGYTLADRNVELERAHSMILKAYLERPDSAPIVDSLGWVLYRQGQLERSIEHLSYAWQLNASSEIGAHLGEVLWIYGKKQQAREVWKKASKLDPANSILLETIQRLNP